jgi:hypothetical protein
MSDASFEEWFAEDYGDVFDGYMQAPFATVKLMLKDAYEAGRKTQAIEDQWRMQKMREELERVRKAAEETERSIRHHLAATAIPATAPLYALWADKLRAGLTELPEEKEQSETS